MIIVAPDGTEVQCFVEEKDGMIDAILRADTRAAWETAAIAAEILEYITLRAPEGDGYVDVLRPVPGNNIDIIGAAVIEEAVLDEEGNEVTPAVLDERFHVNLRLAEPALSKVNDQGYPKWKETVLTWMNFGVEDTESNKNEVGVKLSNVTLIDPSSINTKARVWL